MNSFQIGMNSFRLIFLYSATASCARQKRQWHCVFALLGYLQPAAKLVTGHWWQGTWGQVALTHADTISTQYLHKSIAKFCRHIYQISSIIYYLHTLCSRGAPGLRHVTWWYVSWLPPATPPPPPPLCSIKLYTVSGDTWPFGQISTQKYQVNYQFWCSHNTNTIAKAAPYSE